MSRLNLLYQSTPKLVGKRQHVRFQSETPYLVPARLRDPARARLSLFAAGVLSFIRISNTCPASKIRSISNDALADFSDDDELCPVECVREISTDEELHRIIEKAKEANTLVVVDFYKTACGSCKYIEKGFAKLRRGSGNNEAPVIFLKHNVIDEYDEPSETSERLRVKAVPLFQFYKGGVLLESFATRDKERIDAAILKNIASAASQEA